MIARGGGGGSGSSEGGGDGGSVLVTGLGWTTPLGDSLDGVWERLLAGETGLSVTPSEFPLRTSVAGTVPGIGFDRPAHERQVEMAVRALSAACADAGVDPAAPGVRIVVGTSFGPHLDGAGGTDEADGVGYRLDTWAVEAAGRIGHRSPPLCVSTACSAGSDSLLVAVDLIRSGAARICVAGGVDVVTNAKRLGHSALGTMSADALRAFDERHDGMIPGEGAAFLVLESAESARDRSARVHAVLRGAGSSNDAAGLTIPDPSGDSVVAAVRRCLAAGGRTVRDVAVVNAHATGTPLNDAVETVSLRRLFADADADADDLDDGDGDRDGDHDHDHDDDAEDGPTVFATKGALGHSLGATGAIEAVSVVLALRTGMVPPISGLSSPVADFPLPLAIGGPRKFAGIAGISLTIGFGGFNTCLLFEKAE